MISVRTLKGLLSFLQAHNLSPQKRFSQNFLVDGNILRKIVHEAKVEKDDLVIEIGPGPGALTETLLETGCQVWAIEKDRQLASLLQRLDTGDRLKVFQTDFLLFPIQESLSNVLKPGQKAKIVANLPYHITTPILSMLAPLHHLCSDLILMMQKEVAIRCLAQKKSKDYGCLSLFLQFFCEVTHGFYVSPSCFYPKPSVDSAVIHLRPRSPLKTANPDLLFLLIRSSFQKRRKMVQTSWKELFPSSLLLKAFEQAKIAPSLRPEELSMEQFISLTDALCSLSSIEDVLSPEIKRNMQERSLKEPFSL